MSDELSPENRRLLCHRIGEELGIDGDVLDSVLAPNTVDGLNEFRDACIDWKRKEQIRRGYYEPRCYSVGSRYPETEHLRNPQESFIEMLYDMGL